MTAKKPDSQDAASTIDRRTMLTQAAIGGTLVAAGSLVGCKARVDQSAVLATPTGGAGGGLCRRTRPVDQGSVAKTGTTPAGVKGKIAVLIGNHFDPYEYRDFRVDFPEAGYDVDFVSDLGGRPSVTLVSNTENNGAGGPGPIAGSEIRADGSRREWHHRYWSNEKVTVTKCVRPTAGAAYANPKDYDAVVLIGAMAMEELRTLPTIQPNGNNEAPAVRYIRGIMTDNAAKRRKDGKGQVVVAAICHSLWLLTGTDLLRGRKVTCGHNLIGDVRNAGAKIQYVSGSTERDADQGGPTPGNSARPIVLDQDLLTGRHPEIRRLWNRNIIDLVSHFARQPKAAFRILEYRNGEMVPV